ncbi:hypothetical protein NIES4074_15980 [Cylindrospermum sp. NIES-4074]|nr:hypothetical protein NIES4074_15980 [Cylindrospermum sp. NIES-4074]
MEIEVYILSFRQTTIAVTNYLLITPSLKGKFFFNYIDIINYNEVD